MPRSAPDPALTPREFVFAPGDGVRLPCPGRDRVEYHEPASGLRLRVTATGARSWVVSFWSPVAKVQRRLKLGDPARVDLSKARRLARAALAAVGEGRDPYLERQVVREKELEGRAQRVAGRRLRAEERARRSVTFGAICRSYVEWRRTTPSGRYKRPASPRTLAFWDSVLRLHVLPLVGEVPPEDLKTDHFVRVLEGAVKRGGPSMGPRTREFLSAVWRWLETRSRILGARLPAESPLRELPRDIGSATRERERALSPAEVWQLWRVTESEGLPGLALRFMLLTACRVREATLLPWAEVDTAAKTWTLPAVRSKGGRDRPIPLSGQAVAILNRARSLHGGEYVFDRVRVGESMARIRGAMGGEPWQPRDVRRTGATLCARLGADPFVVALVLGHAHPDERMPAVTRTYLRWGYEDRVRGALERLGEWVEETVSAAEAPGAVLPHVRAQP
jgi:integrase